MRRIFKYFLWGLLAIVIAVGGWIAYGVIRAGSVEAWAGRELSDIAGRYLKPKLHIGKIRYDGGKTISITDLWLDADDPDSPGKKVRVVEVKQGRLELNEVPRWGKPLKIEKLYLDHPVVRFVKAKNAPGLVGFTDLVNKKEAQATTQANSQSQPAAAQASQPAPETAKGPRASDVFQIRLLKIDDGEVDYDARWEGTEPLILDNINSELHVSPDPQAGWYGLQITTDRKPIFAATMKGRINVDTLQLDMQRVTLQLEVSNDNRHYLPQVVQKAVTDYEIGGMLQLEGQGDVPMTDFSKGMLGLKLALSKGNVSIAGFSLPVESLNSHILLHDRLMEINDLNAKALGGTVAITGVFPFDKDQPARINCHVENVHLARTIKTFSKTDAKPAASGLITGDLAYGAPIGEWKSKARGEGTLHLTNGRVPELPVLSAIVAGIDGLGKLNFKHADNHDDRAMTKFVFDGDVVHITTLQVHADTLGVRGNGDVGLNGDLNLRLNAGPLELVEKDLGPVGKFFAGFTDRVGGYTVTGKLGKPIVNFQLGPGK